MEIAVRGQEEGSLDCWHLDCYRRDEADAALWRGATVPGDIS